MVEKKNTYPKSKKGHQCLGPCYYPNTLVVHPLYFTVETSDKSFCPTTKYKYIDPVSGNEYKETKDYCQNPTSHQNVPIEELQQDIITPRIMHNADDFLKTYYDIYSFDQCLEWIDFNKFKPIRTKMRIIDTGLNAYSSEIKLIDTRFASFFIDYIKIQQMTNLYEQINKYIGIKDDNFYFVKDNNLNKRDYCIERINYIISIFLNIDDIIRFMNKYFINNKEKDKIVLKHIYDSYCIYIKNKIDLTIKE